MVNLKVRQHPWLLGLVVVLAAVGLGALAGGWIKAQLSSSGEAGENARQACVDLASSFDEYPILWLGEEYRGLALTQCTHDVTPAFEPDGVLVTPATDSFTFIYGDCTPPAGVPSCPAPLQVTVDSPCTSTPIAESAKASAQSIRGALADVLLDGTVTFTLGAVRVSVLSSLPAGPDGTSPQLDATERLAGANPAAGGLEASSRFNSISAAASSPCSSG